MFTMVQIDRAQSSHHDLLRIVGRTNLESGHSLLYRFLGVCTPIGLGARSIRGRLGQPHVNPLGEGRKRLEVWMGDDCDAVRH